MPPHEIDHTHAPALRSWVASANEPETDFPIQNLPFGVFAPTGQVAGRVGIAIGDRILDVAAALDAGAFTGAARDAAGLCRGPTLNALFAAGRQATRALRTGASAFLAADHARAAREGAGPTGVLVRMADVELRLPVAIGDYTDFYASVYHATNVGALFRPDNPLLPNYKHIPIGYHGRASSIRVSGGPVIRPHGQTRSPDAVAPVFGPTRALDYEAEMGFFIGRGNALGEPIPIDRAEDHLVGVCLVNDWSARDIQSWEYQPLGPFLAKNFGTTISPWVVSWEALTPFRAPAFVRPAGDPAPLPYLRSEVDARLGAIDIGIEVLLRSRQMRDAEIPPVRLSRGRLTDLYWTPAQMVAHHTSNGCDLRTGDLLASGTVSGPTPDSLGCLLELTARGARPFMLPSGEQRTFLEDGDEVTMRARCERSGAATIGFGTCRGTIVPAMPARDGAGWSAPLPGASASP
jgi:fumarylacetoacetase